jgi:hypothetical protein
VLSFTQRPPQLEYPELQVPTPHCPDAQPGVPFEIAGQTWPQEPQLFTSEEMGSLQPLDWSVPEQFAQPESQVPLQAPFVQPFAATFVLLQAAPHVPQSATSVSTWSHPSGHGE